MLSSTSTPLPHQTSSKVDVLILSSHFATGFSFVLKVIINTNNILLLMNVPTFFLSKRQIALSLFIGAELD